MERSHIIFTGGSGLLGTAFQKIEPEILYPSSADFDILNYDRMQMYAEAAGCEMIIHAAADTNVLGIQLDPINALEVNIMGTANVVKLCESLQADLIYISSDYVFKGDRGDYKEGDELLPFNRYGWSKLGGECAVRMYNRGLIVRTSFGPLEFPHQKAFVDQWTSKITVTKFASYLSMLIDKRIRGVLHIAGERKTVMEYAQSVNPARQFGELSIKEIVLPLPTDTSLNSDDWDEGRIDCKLGVSE